MIGFGISAYADCDKATVVSADADISGHTVTITVKISPTFTPTEPCSYTFIVAPIGEWVRILSSQTQSTTLDYSQQNGWTGKNYVQFKCSVDDNSYNQCNSNSFTVTGCFKR